MDIYGNIMQTACDVAGEDVSAGYPRTVTGALDALADALAGSDVDGGRTIAEAVAAVGENIGGGGGGLPNCQLILAPYESSIELSTLEVGVVNDSDEMTITGADFLPYTDEEGYYIYDGTIPAGSCVYIMDSSEEYAYYQLGCIVNFLDSEGNPSDTRMYETGVAAGGRAEFTAVPNYPNITGVIIQVLRELVD